MEALAEAAKGADVIAILTEWDEFSYINFRKLKEQTDCRILVDGRNMYSPERMAALGFHYDSIGRKKVTPLAVTSQGKAEKGAPKRIDRDLEKV